MHACLLARRCDRSDSAWARSPSFVEQPQLGIWQEDATAGAEGSHVPCALQLPARHALAHSRLHADPELLILQVRVRFTVTDPIWMSLTMMYVKVMVMRCHALLGRGRCPNGQACHVAVCPPHC
eukprot:366056-Chlamydomonas_euryale.AAC.6